MSLNVLIAVTHLLGAGHLTRAAAIARGTANAGHRVTLVSGGRPAPLIPTDGVDLVQLPPVRATADDLGTLRDADGIEVSADYLLRRRALLLSTLRAARPDVVITELFPFGRRSLAAEFVALIEAAAGAQPRPRIIASIRDILVPPDKPAKVERTRDLITRYFDAVLVHGDPGLVPLDASWPMEPVLASRLIYTGYVDGESDPSISPDRQAGEIVVSGGSSEAALPLYRAALRAAPLVPQRPWRILIGAGVSDQAAAELRAETGRNIVIEPAHREFRATLAQAAVLVGQSGYNTVMDILASRTRAILVPFERGRETEQRLRAERLAAAGLATILPEAELSGAALAALVRAQLDAAEPPFSSVDRRGAARTAEILFRLATSSRAGRPVIGSET